MEKAIDQGIDRNRQDVVEIVDSIKRRLPASVESEQPCTIFRVPNVIRQVDENLYEPKVISIGPYHHGKERLKSAEAQKMRHLQSILSRNRDVRLEDYAKEIKGSEERARKCYWETISPESNEFVEMMLLDGCFLVETLIQFYQSCRRTGRIISISREYWFTHFMFYDMLLLENQLPFFILERIFRLAMPSGEISSMTNLALACFDFIRIIEFNHAKTGDRAYHHLLDLFRYHYSPTPKSNNGDGSTAGASLSRKLKVKEQLTNCFLCVQSEAPSGELPPFTIPSAEELKAAGVKFKKQEEPGSFIDIEFHKNGVIKIPKVVFAEEMIYAFKNVVAFEQCYLRVDSTFFTAYARFMDEIINTRKDFQILRHNGILEHSWGSDEEFAGLFNKMNRGLVRDEGHLDQVYRDLNEYCGTKRHIWRANLMQNYFNTPWAILSFAAALLLLLLTTTQTFFTVFPR